MKRTRCLALFLGLLLFLPAIAHAEYFPPDRTPAVSGPDLSLGFYNQPMVHDTGLFLRTTAGTAWFHSSSSRVWPAISGSGVYVTGPGVELNAAVGGVIAQNLAIHATFGFLFAPSPEVETPEDFLMADSSRSVFFNFGPGVTGYFLRNAYISASTGVTFMAHRFEDARVVQPRRAAGLFFEATIGKEWWIGPNTGVGIFGRLTTHRVKTDYYAPFSGVTLSGGFSFTLN